MKFKIDENLPVEFAELLLEAAYDAVTVAAQALQGRDDSTVVDVCVQEERVLVTLDLILQTSACIRRKTFQDSSCCELATKTSGTLLKCSNELCP